MRTKTIVVAASVVSAVSSSYLTYKGYQFFLKKIAAPLIGSTFTKVLLRADLTDEQWSIVNQELQFETIILSNQDLDKETNTSVHQDHSV